MLGQWEEAAERMPTIFDHDAPLWEKNIFLFAEKGHLKVSLQTRLLVDNRKSLPTSQRKILFYHP